MKTVNIEILRVGRWNGRDFDSQDLADIVSSFDGLELSGRVPVGIGHQRRDDRESEGWIVALRLRDNVLVATVEIVNEELLGKIEAGKFKNVSVELMYGVESDGADYPVVLCGLAILGGVPPAVIGLQPLDKAIQERVGNAARAERIAFAVKGVSLTRERSDDASRLRQENAKLVTQLIDAKFNAAIEAGTILPRDREAFRKRYSAKGTVADAEAWIASSPKPPSAGPSTRRTPDEPVTGSPDEQLVSLANEAMRAARGDGETLTFEQAAVKVMRANPDLARKYQAMPTDLYGQRQ